MLKKLTMAVAVTFAASAYAGEWHTGANNLCTDCHTMHFSMAHTWDNTGTVSNTPAADGDWMGTTGPNHYLLKLPANELCLACHNGQTFAPDVAGPNTNSYQRAAGFLNGAGTGAANTFTGHTLGATENPPGYDPTQVGLSATWYNAANGLECLGCHTQHGTAGVYRNLGPRSLGRIDLDGAGAGTATANYLPTYALGTTNNADRDVWINVAGFTPGISAFSTFYAQGSVSYNRVDRTPIAGVMPTQTSNGIDTMCAACHGNFHGGPGDAATVGGIIDAAAPGGTHEFSRHPTSMEQLNTGSSGTSNISRLRGATAVGRIKVYSDTPVWTAPPATGLFADATPGCVSCHKAHGNDNPFALVFQARNAASVDENGGGWARPASWAGSNYITGYTYLCGQCHGQGQ